MLPRATVEARFAADGEIAAATEARPRQNPAAHETSGRASDVLRVWKAPIAPDVI